METFEIKTNKSGYSEVHTIELIKDPSLKVRLHFSVGTSYVINTYLHPFWYIRASI